VATGGSVKLSYRRIYEKRAENFFCAVAEQAGMSSDELVDQIAAGGKAADLVNLTLHRSAEKGDPIYRDAPSALVAAALVDDAKFDETAYIVNRIIQIEAIHIRILDASVSAMHNGGAQDSRNLIGSKKVASMLATSEGVVGACFDELTAVGFIKLHNENFWKVSALGLAAIEEIRRVQDNLQSN
jgi:hypothetical protein